MRSPAPIGLLLLASASAATSQEPQDGASAAQKLFLANCASCHGETGNGQGTAQLDRPARSFQDGGFSFGNTPEALFKTISVGIPGSPMPSFDLLPEADRRALADYVITLGPPVEEVKLEDTILTVHDRPLVVRGMLPPLAEGLPEHPRGLLIGDPSGITFEYRVDDVRLLALRQGGFVRRTDWSGRGGTPLEPLGKVVLLVEGGNPEATFLSKSKPLEARLSGTRLTQHAGLVEYHLIEGGRELAHITEFCSVLTTSFGTGYQRELGIVPGNSPVDIEVRTPAIEGTIVLAQGVRKFERLQVVRPKEGPPVFVDISSYQPSIGDIGRGQFEATLSLKAGEQHIGVSVFTLVLVGWNEDIQKQLERWYEEM